jgi:two-component system NtrC family response regulator
VHDPPRDLDELPRVAEAPPTDATRALIGESLAVRALRASVATLARATGAVLLLGPTGVGKEVAAEAVHRASGLEGPLIPLNCAALPEAELFGVVKGAFTGADARRDGAFVRADGGTLFLDEVGELPRPVQAKLLRVLEDGVVHPLGGGAPRRVTVRVLAATHAALDAEGFRPDLRARLSDWVLHIPPLAERRADILPLFRHFLASEGREDLDLPAELVEALLVHDWPLNVRELRGLARRVCGLCPPGTPLGPHLLPSALRRAGRRIGGGPRSGPDEGPTTEAPEPSRDALERALTEAEGNVSRAAKRHGWHRTQLYRWLRRHGLDPAAFRP